MEKQKTIWVLYDENYFAGAFPSESEAKKAQCVTGDNLKEVIIYSTAHAFFDDQE